MNRKTMLIVILVIGLTAVALVTSFVLITRRPIRLSPNARIEIRIAEEYQALGYTPLYHTPVSSLDLPQDKILHVRREPDLTSSDIKGI